MAIVDPQRILEEVVSEQTDPMISPLVKEIHDGGWPTEDEVKSVHEQFLLQRAVHSYMLTLPTINVIGL